jgi:Rod binding domain-containing protein
MGPTETFRVTQPLAAASAPKTANQARTHRVATQFEAMFMTEMLHQAHGKSHAVGVFRTGSGEDTMRPFMDQALGDAIASRHGTGIAQSIERALNKPVAGKDGK